MTILSLFTLGLLSGCGIRAPLKTPPPLFGSEAKVDENRAPNENADTTNDDEDGYINLDVEDQDTLSDF